MLKNWFIVFSLSLFFSNTLVAKTVVVKVINKVNHENFSLGLGSRVELHFTEKGTRKEVLFLGRMIDQEKKNIEFLFLDEAKSRVLMINPENIEGIRKSSAQPVISPIDQLGSTCTAYAVLHYWNQIDVSSPKREGELRDLMSSDRRRLQFIEEIIDIYYLQDRTNITRLMNNFAERFDFKCKNNAFKDSELAAEFLFNTAGEGRPILVDFNIGSDMVSSTYQITDYETPLSRDPSLWIPRKVGERAKSGHVIVVAGSFVSKGKKKLLVLDSNWTEPRIWDLDQYIGFEAAVKEMGFHTCQ